MSDFQVFANQMNELLATEMWSFPTNWKDAIEGFRNTRVPGLPHFISGGRGGGGGGGDKRTNECGRAGGSDRKQQADEESGKRNK